MWCVYSYFLYVNLKVLCQVPNLQCYESMIKTLSTYSRRETWSLAQIKVLLHKQTMTATAIRETQSSYIWFCTKGEYVLASVCLWKCLKTFLWWYSMFNISTLMVSVACCIFKGEYAVINDVVWDMSGCDLIPFCVCTTKCSYDLMKLHTMFQIWLLVWTRHIVEELLGTCSCYEIPY